MAFVVRTFDERMNDNLIMHFTYKTSQMGTRIYQHSLNATKFVFFYRVSCIMYRGFIEFIKVCKAVVRTGRLSVIIHLCLLMVCNYKYFSNSISMMIAVFAVLKVSALYLNVRIYFIKGHGCIRQQ